MFFQTVAGVLLTAVAIAAAIISLLLDELKGKRLLKAGIASFCVVVALFGIYFTIRGSEVSSVQSASPPIASSDAVPSRVVETVVVTSPPSVITTTLIATPSPIPPWTFSPILGESSGGMKPESFRLNSGGQGNQYLFSEGRLQIYLSVENEDTNNTTTFLAPTAAQLIATVPNPRVRFSALIDQQKSGSRSSAQYASVVLNLRASVEDNPWSPASYYQIEFNTKNMFRVVKKQNTDRELIGWTQTSLFNLRSNTPTIFEVETRPNGEILISANDQLILTIIDPLPLTGDRVYIGGSVTAAGVPTHTATINFLGMVVSDVSR